MISGFHKVCFIVSTLFTALSPSFVGGAFLQSNYQSSSIVTVCHKMSTESSTTEPQIPNENHQKQTTIRVLALHGSEGTAEEFITRLDPLVIALKNKHNIQLSITSIQGPFSKGQGYAWWTMKPGARSFTATEYEGFDLSSTQVLDAWKKGDNNSKDDLLLPFDIIFGHSQGAIMISALLALDQVPYHPKIGYILNGVAIPNPYLTQLESLKFRKGSGDDDTDTSSSTSSPPRVLFLMGDKDKINPPTTTGKQVRDLLENSGMSVQTIQHPGGHGIPLKSIDDDDPTMNDMISWILNQSRKK